MMMTEWMMASPILQEKAHIPCVACGTGSSAPQKGINTSTSHSWWDLYLEDMEAEFMDSMATVS